MLDIEALTLISEPKTNPVRIYIQPFLLCGGHLNLKSCFGKSGGKLVGRKNFSFFFSKGTIISAVYFKTGSNNIKILLPHKIAF